MFSARWWFSCITGSLQVLAHRLGLIPIFADPREFDFRPEGESRTLLCTVALVMADIDISLQIEYFFSFLYGHHLQCACVTPVPVMAVCVTQALITSACVMLACHRLTDGYQTETHPPPSSRLIESGDSPLVFLDCFILNSKVFYFK